MNFHHKIMKGTRRTARLLIASAIPMFSLQAARLSRAAACFCSGVSAGALGAGELAAWDIFKDGTSIRGNFQ